MPDGGVACRPAFPGFEFSLLNSGFYSAASPSLNRAKRATAMFSPVLATASRPSATPSCAVADGDLVEQAHPLEEAVELALDDLLDHGGGLAGVAIWAR